MGDHLLRPIKSIFDPFGAASDNKSDMDKVVNSQNVNYQKARDDYRKNLDKNTGANAYNASYNTGKAKAKELADEQTRLAAQNAAQQAYGRMISSNISKGRSAMDASNGASNYAQMYGNAFGNAFQNQQNAYAQQLANQQNAYGTLMSSEFANDQAQYNQGMNNIARGTKTMAGPWGMIGDALSDESLKDKAKVGIDDEKDLRMAHYKRCSDKLKRMNPNKWKELHWEGR